MQLPLLGEALCIKTGADHCLTQFHLHYEKNTHKSKKQKTLNHISFIKKTKEKQQTKFNKSTLYIKYNILHLILNLFNYKQINCNKSYQIALV